MALGALQVLPRKSRRQRRRRGRARAAPRGRNMAAQSGAIHRADPVLARQVARRRDAAERLVVKPNFAKDRHGTNAAQALREGALYVGRLSEEKVASPGGRLAGTGRRARTHRGRTASRRSASQQGAGAHFRGFVSDDERGAWRASFRHAVACSRRLPHGRSRSVRSRASHRCLAPRRPRRIGGGRATGLQFAGDPADLAAKARWRRATPTRWPADGAKRARAALLQMLHAGAAMPGSMEIYAEAIQHRAVQ